MKLAKIKLINWHIFSNSLISLDGNTLITGENASGKSTLMDAIYFILSAGDKDHFNKAANQGSKRTLESYMRGKLGGEKNPNLRNGSDVISYIVLEFHDEKRKYSMALGAEMEIQSSQNAKTHFFVIENYKINETDFIKDKKPLNIKDFKNNAKALNLGLNMLPETKKDLRRVLAKDIFKIDDYNRYYDLLQNAISFKPISEVSTFVNSFLLKDEPIDLSNLMQEIRAYQEIHRLVEKEKEKILALTEFTPSAEKYIKYKKDLKYFDVLKNEIQIEKLEKNIKSLQLTLEKIEAEILSLNVKEKELDSAKETLSHQIKLLEDNDSYKALLEKKRNLSELERSLKDINNKLNKFKDSLETEENLATKLGLKLNVLQDFKNKDYPRIKGKLVNYSETLEGFDDDTRNKRINLQNTKESNDRLIKSKEIELTKLEQGLNNYPNELNTLIEISRDAIKSHFPKDTNPLCEPLCEFIDVKDLKWQNALEGYLNTRKFNLIVDPKYYSVVSETYDKYKSIRKIYGYGIVNIKEVPEVSPLKNSLVEKIEVSNKYASVYANYVLGNLIAVDKVSELEEYDAAITSEVMVYRNYCLKATDPKTYQVPYIGKKSREIRINLLKEEISLLKSENERIQAQIDELRHKLSLKSTTLITTLLQTPNYFPDKDSLDTQIVSLKSSIEVDELDTSLLEIGSKIERAKRERDEAIKNLESLKKDKSLKDQDKGQTLKSISDNKISIGQKQALYQTLAQKLDISEYSEFKKTYIVNNKYDYELIEKDNNKELNYIYHNKDKLLGIMNNYTNKYKPSLAQIEENMQSYVNEYYDLTNRGVVEYERHAKEAYERAEASFKEDFISKLKSKIEESQEMLSKINRNLSLHPFGNDEEIYKFSYGASKDNEFANYYRIITSGKLMESKDLFTEILDEKDNSYMSDLFDHISKEVDSAQAQEELDRYLDYRNYMNYDIKITNKYGEELYFSKINREKSGGETQTPFYIVIASCFDELMNKDSNKVESTCQVVFDEAFNNMDESRIKSLMEFYKKLNVQIIIIVPSNRITAISPYMDTLIGITKINNHPYINVVLKDEK